MIAPLQEHNATYTDWRDESGNIVAKMLTDLAVDPNEMRNVAEEASYAEVVEELSGLITADQSGLHWAPRVQDFVTARDSAQRVAQ